MLLSFMEVMDTELVWDMLVLAMVLDLAMLVFGMEPMDMVPVLDMLDSDMDIPVLDMLVMVVMVLAMAVSAMLVLATMARGLLMLSPRLMLVCTMEDMVMELVWDMLDLDMDIPVLDMLDMVVMDSDTVLGT